MILVCSEKFFNINSFWYELSKNLFVGCIAIMLDGAEFPFFMNFNNLRINLNNDFSEEINNSNLCKRLKIMLEDKDSNSFIKLFPKIYPNLLNINSMKQQIVELTPKSLGVIEDYDINNQLENFVYNLNKINAFFFINYYLFTTGEDLYIPSFYYYKIPGPHAT